LVVTEFVKRAVVTLAVPRTYRFEPTGGAERVPMDTPFAYATLPATVAHWDERIATFEAVVIRPYWSTDTWDTLALEPYCPATTPVWGKFVVEISPNKLAVLRLDNADPLPI
jgi:hypothetical protein